VVKLWQGEGPSGGQKRHEVKETLLRHSMATLVNFPQVGYVGYVGYVPTK